MSKLTYFLLSLTSAVVLFPVRAVEATGLVLPNPSKYNSLEDIINAVFGLVRPIVMIAFIVALMIGGWTRLSSAGDPDKIAKSQKIMVAAIVGFAIIALAPILVDFVGNIIGVQGGLLSL